MSSHQRVVIKSSWAVHIVSAAAVYFLPLLVVAAVGNRFLFLIVLGAFPVAVLFGRLTAYVVLTALGLGIHGLSGMTTVPWVFIGSVDYVIKGRLHYLTIQDVSANRTRTLSAPRVMFDVGRWEAAETCTVIETWWLANRGSTPPVASRPVDW